MHLLRGNRIAASSIVVGLTAWEFVSRFGLIPLALFPPPTIVVLAAFDWAISGDLYIDLISSVWRATAGFISGSILGIALGLATGRSRYISQFLSPAIQAARPLPPVAIIPLVIVWLGIGEMSKIFSIAFATFFPVWINAHSGASQISRTYIWTATLLKLPAREWLFSVVFPATLPQIVIGLRSGIAMAFVMVFVSELAGASSGLGYYINASHLAYRVDRMIAGLCVLGCLGAFADYLLVRLLWVAFPWLRLV